MSLKIEIQNAWQYWKAYKQSFSNVLEWWDTGKCILRDICKKISIDLKQTEMLTHENNKKTLLEIIDQDSLSFEDKNLKLKLENQIQYYYEIQFQGTRIRSKTQKVVNETPSKSFSGIEINKARQKTSPNS